MKTICTNCKLNIKNSYYLGRDNPHFATMGGQSSLDEHLNPGDVHPTLPADGAGTLGRSGCTPTSTSANGMAG